MSATICHSCYLATTKPEWVARTVVQWSRDTPCERHAHTDENTTALGEMFGGFAAAVSAVGRSFAAGIERALEAQAEAERKRALERAEYEASDRGKLDALYSTCSGNVPGLLHASELAAEYFTDRAHRELDELLEQINAPRSEVDHWAMSWALANPSLLTAHRLTDARLRLMVDAEKENGEHA